MGSTGVNGLTLALIFIKIINDQLVSNVWSCDLMFL